jgi:multiple sugar transport system substrate-binding protein
METRKRLIAWVSTANGSSRIREEATMNPRKQQLIWLSTRIGAILIALAFASAACGPAPTPAAPQVSAPTTAATQAIPPTAAAPQTVTLWMAPTAIDTNGEHSAFDHWTKLFESRFPGTKVNLVWVDWGDLYLKQAAALKSGEPPELHMTGPEAALSWVAENGAEPLDDVVQQLGGESVFYPNTLQYCKYQGHIYCLPNLIGGKLLFYRKDILAKAGYDKAPDTWDDLIKVGQAINKPDQDFYALGMDYSQGNGLQQLFVGIMWSYGAEIMNKDGKVDIDSPQTAQALQLMDDLYTKYKLLPPGVTAVSQYATVGTPLTQWYGQGKIGMTLLTTFDVDSLKKQYPEIWKVTGVAPPPKGASGHTGSFANEGVWAIMKGAKNVQLAKELLKLYYSEEIQDDYLSFVGAVAPVVGVHPSVENEDWYKTYETVIPYAQRFIWTYGGHPKGLAFHDSFLLGSMVQDVVINRMSIPDALKKYQAAYENILTGQ